tara:strand:- start:1349 stop:1582 length:234 start_codon:yes stop_codon:yes gene_type:complete
MGIKGVVSRVATIGGVLSNTTNLRAKQVTVGSTMDLGTKSIQELSDVAATETDDAMLVYDAATDKWIASTNIDGGTF